MKQLNSGNKSNNRSRIFLEVRLPLLYSVYQILDNLDSTAFQGKVQPEITWLMKN